MAKKPKEPKPQDILNPTGAPVLVKYVSSGQELFYKVPAGGVSYARLLKDGIDAVALLASTHLNALKERGTLSLRPAAPPAIPAEA